MRKYFLALIALALFSECMPVPSACGYPDWTNSGPRLARNQMLRVPEDVTSGPGWVWDGVNRLVRIDGTGAAPGSIITFQKYIIRDATIDVNASGYDVRVADNVVVAFGEGQAFVVRNAAKVSINFNEIGPPSGSHERLLQGVYFVGSPPVIWVQGNIIRGTSTAIQGECGTWRDNFVVDMGFKTGDHINGYQSGGGASCQLNIIHNTIINRYDQADAIMLAQDFGTQKNRLVDNNLIAGGGYTLYAGYTGLRLATSNIKITNNRFARLVWPNGGFYGPFTAWQASGVGNFWDNNFWDDTETPINP
jgi:hypothetical protein